MNSLNSDRLLLTSSARLFMVEQSLTIMGGGYRAAAAMLRIRLSIVSELRTPSRQKQMWYQGVAVCIAVAIGVAATLSPAPESRAERTSPRQAAPPPVVQAVEKTAAVAAVVPAPSIKTPEPAAPATEVERVVTVKRGDTFMKVLRSAGAGRTDSAGAIAVMRKVFDPRGLRPGQTITVALRRDAGGKIPPQLMGYSFDAGLESAVKVERDASNAFTAKEIKKNLALRHRRSAGVIKSSLYKAGVRAGLPVSVLVELIHLFSWDVDFQRDIQPDDRFDIMFEQFQQADGSVARHGGVLFAELQLSGVRHRLYRYKVPNQIVEYFDEKGRSARKALMKTPIDGARLSSGYGRRRHPILGYNRMHRGIDFAAPRGTPIYAAGNGTVNYAGRNGAYGKYIRIRHNGKYSTAYAHLNGYARGLRKGKRVRQGQIIGYLGSTGRSTGPHLHYEILVGSRQVNPFRIRLPSGRNLDGPALKSFEKVRDGIDQRLAGLPPTTTVTSR